ncbi:hypothetical protein ES703_125567 [subsurface metagenome]
MKVITLSVQLKLPLTVGEIEKAASTEDVFIASLKVTWMVVSIATLVASGAGEVVTTVGGVVSMKNGPR